MTVPTYFFTNEVTLNQEDLEYTDLEPNTTVDGEPYYIEELPFGKHLYVVTTFLGLLLVSICGGIGIVYLPYNLLNDWIFRPKPIQRADFVKRQKIIMPLLLNLRREGKHLESERM